MDLNLLPDVARFQADKIKFKRKIKEWSVVILAVWLSVLVVVMVVYWLNRLSVAKMEAKYKLLLADYMTMSDGVVINQNLRRKSKIIAQILAQRFEYGKTFRKMESLFGPEVRVTKMELKGKNSFMVDGEVERNDLMDMVESKIVEIAGGRVEEFSGAKIKSVGLSKGVWKFSLEVGLR